MSERLFLLELKMELRGLPEQTVEEIMEDYNVYFQEAKHEGLTEDEVIDRLGGSAKTLAHSIVEKVNMEKVEVEHSPSSAQSVLIVIGLILFNLIIVLGPFLALVGAGISLLVVFGVSLISPLLVLLGFMVQGGHLFDLMVSFIMFGGALLIFPAVRNGVHMVNRVVKLYIKWNKRVIHEGKL